MLYKNIKLKQPQRIIVATIYLILVFVCVSLLGGNIKELLIGATDESIWFQKSGDGSVIGDFRDLNRP